MYSLTKLYSLNKYVKNNGLPVINNNIDNICDNIVINKIYYNIEKINNIYIILPIINAIFMILTISSLIFKINIHLYNNGR
jgi:hypothetical protein